MSAWQELSIEQAHDLWKSTPDLVVFDVRTAEEYTGPCGNIPGSHHVPIDRFAEHLPQMEALRGRPIMAICYSGVRSRGACRMLAARGFDRLYNAPGMMFWNDAGYETVPGQPTPDMPEC